MEIFKSSVHRFFLDFIRHVGSSCYYDIYLYLAKNLASTTTIRSHHLGLGFDNFVLNILFAIVANY